MRLLQKCVLVASLTSACGESSSEDSPGLGGGHSSGGNPTNASGGSDITGGRASGGSSNASGGSITAKGGETASSGGATSVAGAAAGGNSSGGAPNVGGSSAGGNSGGGKMWAMGGKASASSGGAKSFGGAAGASSGGTSSGGTAGTSSGGSGGGTSSNCANPSTYDALILCEKPVGYWTISHGSGNEPDLSGRNNSGSYRGGATTSTALPNGDSAAVFNGSSQYLTIPSSPAYSIPTTGKLTWEAWIKPSVLQFPNDSGGYVDWMGKCASYSPTCEWEARLYNTDNSQDRCNRFSAYAFNSSAGLGSGADFQPTCGLIKAGTWYHVVGEYTTLTQPSACQNTASYPGALDIWVNGVKWNQARHGQTGCMSQYNVIPKANDSPVNVATMAQDAWFQGAIAKLAIYDELLTDAQVKAHYRAMTGLEPTGSCASECSF